MIMVLALLSGRQKHPHESDHSDSDKEVNLLNLEKVAEIPQHQLVLILNSSAPDNSVGWIDVRRKKNDPRWSTQ